MTEAEKKQFSIEFLSQIISNIPEGILWTDAEISALSQDVLAVLHKHFEERKLSKLKLMLLNAQLSDYQKFQIQEQLK